jgi:hypothetical protein
MSEETWRLIEERRKAKINIGGAKTRTSKKFTNVCWNNLKKEVKKSCKRDKRIFVKILADEAEAATRVNDMKRLYEMTRKL